MGKQAMISDGVTGSLLVLSREAAPDFGGAHCLRVRFEIDHWQLL